IPLHGFETILEAARRAPEIAFRVVGSGQLEPLLAARPENVEWTPWVDYEQLPGELQRCGCALGIFGTSDKAARVIPNKVFQALARAHRGAAVKALVGAAVAAYAAGFSALSIQRDRAFETGRFDLGNMVQAIWSTAHGHPLRITDLQGDQISRLGAHVDPILVVFAPLWWIWPSPDLLLVVQALAVGAGALPVYWLARKHLGSARAGLGFALAYLLYPATNWLPLNEFHSVALATP